jgi:hypothetical protein
MTLVIPALRPVAHLARSSHERLDGRRDIRALLTRDRSAVGA